MHRLRAHRIRGSSKKSKTPKKDEEKAEHPPIREAPKEEVGIYKSVNETLENIIKSFPGISEKAVAEVLSWSSLQIEPISPTQLFEILRDLRGVDVKTATLVARKYQLALHQESGASTFGLQQFSSSFKTPRTYSEAEVAQMRRIDRLENMLEKVLGGMESNPGGDNVVLKKIESLEKRLEDQRFSRLEKDLGDLKNTVAAVDAKTVAIREINETVRSWMGSERGQETKKKVRKLTDYITEPLSEKETPKEKLVERGSAEGLLERMDKEYVIEE